MVFLRTDRWFFSSRDGRHRGSFNSAKRELKAARDADLIAVGKVLRRCVWIDPLAVQEGVVLAASSAKVASLR